MLLNSLRIPDIACDLDIDVLRDGIEKYWWPRLYENMLEVELFDEDMELAPPRPRGRRELRPFMACFDLVAGRTPEPTDNQKLQRFQSFEGTHLGACAMEALKHEEEEEIDTDTAFVNTVALMRGPRMVVEYQSLGLSHHEPAIGVYIAHSDLELAAKLSEPGTHDRWDPASRRLKSHDAQALDVLLTRLKVSFRNFQRSLTPPPPRSQGRVPELERLLGRFFKVRDDPSPPSPPPPPTEDPINLHFEPIERTVSTEGATLPAEIRIRLRENAPMEEEWADIRIDAEILADDTRRVDESIQVFLSSDDVDAVMTTDETNRALIKLSKGRFKSIVAETAPHDPLWVCQLSVRAEKHEGIV